MIKWDDASVRSLDDIQLLNLMENAKRRAEEHVLELCVSEIKRRKLETAIGNVAARKTARVRNVSGARRIEADADELLCQLATELMASYDLSKETALKLSGNRIRPLALLSKNGKLSKLGGIQKRGQFAVYRYISYRTSDATVSLAAVMAHEDEGRVTWQMNGPDHLVTEKEERYPNTEVSRGAWFEDFESAAAQFRRLIAKIAPKAPENPT